MDIDATWTTPGFSGLIGVSRRDITPPTGILSHNWGPTVDPVSQGAHRPMTLTALSLRPDASAKPLVVITVDLCSWSNERDEWRVRRPILEALQLDVENVMVHLTHTHSAPSVSTENVGEPGGHLIEPYLDALAEAALSAARESVDSEAPASLRWATGRCDLAANRDLPHHNRYVVAFNPDAPADDTMLVGRVTEARTGAFIATMVNYACHPTTLAWQNHKISPDYVGAMREVLEDRYHVPCLFLQGASGDHAPRRQYSGDLELADQHGRRLGHAAVSTIEGMLPTDQELVFAGVTESGAALGMWELGEGGFASDFTSRLLEMPLRLTVLPTIEELRERWQDVDQVPLTERLRRARRKAAYYEAKEEDGRFAYPVWISVVGSGIFVAIPGEAYAFFQRRLRERFADRAVVVMNLTNSPHSCYLPTAEMYGKDVYEVWQTVFEMGGLETLTDAVIEEIESLTNAKVESS